MEEWSGTIPVQADDTADSAVAHVNYMWLYHFTGVFTESRNELTETLGTLAKIHTMA